MPLTPEDVSNKRFTAVRLREGYDMGEVDQFLDEVEAELTRLHAENDELRSKLEASQRGESVEVPPRPETQPKPEPEPEPEPESPSRSPSRSRRSPSRPTAERPAPADDENVVAEFETIRVTTTAEASRAATRLLEMAGSNADELVSEAQQEADKILAEAKSEAERLEKESAENAQRAEQEARERAEALESETAERRKQLMGDLESEKSKLEGEVGELREFEKTYRQELRDYFQKQLSSLQGDSGRGADAGSGGQTPQESSNG